MLYYIYVTRVSYCTTACNSLFFCYSMPTSVFSSPIPDNTSPQPQSASTRTRAALLLFAILPFTSFSAVMTISIDNGPNAVVSEPVVVTDDIIALDEEIVVQFTHPVTDTTAYQSTISCYPSEQLLFAWNGAQELHIIPQTLWDPETTYSLAFPAEQSPSDTGLSQIFHFTTHPYPRVISTSIVNDEMYLAENDTVTVTFDRSIVDFDVSTAIRPFIPTQRTPSESDNTATFRIGAIPEDAVGTHNITIFVRHKSTPHHTFYPTITKNFTTVMPMPHTWPQPIDERLEIAKKATMPRITTGKYIDVNLAAQVTTLFDNGKYVTSFANSPGAAATPTPTGSFTIHNKDPYALSNLLGVYMPYWMAFTENGEYGIHGLVIWPEGHEEMPEGGKESTSSIGRSVSPGCVRHDAKNSEAIYKWTSVGTPVIIY